MDDNQPQNGAGGVGGEQPTPQPPVSNGDGGVPTPPPAGGGDEPTPGTTPGAGEEKPEGEEEKKPW